MKSLNLSFYPKSLKKGAKYTYLHRGKEIIKVRKDINKIEKRKINETKDWFFKKKPTLNLTKL